MAVCDRARRCVSFALLAIAPVFAAACGDDEAVTPAAPEAETGTITGRVTNAATGQPIVGAQVATSPASTIGLTDGTGTFTIPNVPEGSVTVIATAQGFGPGFVQVVVEAEATVTANIQLTPEDVVGDTLGAVSGIVQRRNGQPVAGAEVRILPSGSSCADTTIAPVATATTDAGGGFLIENLTAGTYLACARAIIGGQPFSGQAAFVIVPGGDLDRIQLSASAFILAVIEERAIYGTPLRE
jgi:hypothetical protein